jgi:hypothetical protein
MATEPSPSIEHAKVRLLAGPLTEEEDPELWAQVLVGRDHLARWFSEIGVQLVVHPDYRIALLRQTSQLDREQRAADAGKAVLPPVLKSRALTFLESQVLSYLHEKLNAAASMGIHELIVLRSEVHDTIVNLQPPAQRVREATLTSRIDAALNKFRDYGLLEETQLGTQPAIQPKLVLLVAVPREELERFDTLLDELLDTPSDDTSDAAAEQSHVAVDGGIYQSSGVARHE